MSFLHALRQKLRFRALEPGDSSQEGDRQESSLDAGAAAAAQSMDSAGPGYPPGYVNDYDDGRPRH